MELRKENVHVLWNKSRAESHITFDEDCNVPDIRPDIGRMIQSKGEVLIEEVNLSNGKAFIKGNFKVDLLYVGETEGQVHSFSVQIPIQEILNLNGIESGDKMQLKWEIEDLCVRVIHSRKVSIKAIVSFDASVDELKTISFPVEVKEEGISVKTKQVQVLGLCVHRKDTMRIKEEITLASNKPNIAGIIWDSIEIRGLDIRPAEDQVLIKGELCVFLLYEGEGENILQWQEYMIPFRGEVECSGCGGDMLPDIDVTILKKSMEVKPDADGEERMLQIDAVLELDMKFYQEQEKNILEDVYTPSKECKMKSHKENLESLLVRNYSKCRVNDKVEIKENPGKVLQICHSYGKVKIEKMKITKYGILAEGFLHLRILYIVGNDEMPFYSKESMVPFSHEIEAKGITEQCVYYIRPDLEQLSTSMLDSQIIEVKAAISLNALVLKRAEEEILDDVEEHPLDLAEIQSMPGITVYLMKPQDTLWDIAKRFYTTVEQIKEINELKEEPSPGQPLILVKNVTSCG